MRYSELVEQVGNYVVFLLERAPRAGAVLLSCWSR